MQRVQICPLCRGLYDIWKNRKSVERTLKNIIPFTEEKLFLKMNRKKIGGITSAKSNTLAIASIDTREYADFGYILNQ